MSITSLSRKALQAPLITLILIVFCGHAHAEPDRFAVETNVLWPFLGISETKVLLPVFDSHTFRGHALIGLHSDFMQASREKLGKLRVLALKIGFRQYLLPRSTGRVARGFHVEVSANLGWRREQQRPTTGQSHNDFVISTWGMVGFQFDLDPRVYINVRGGVGYIAYRGSNWPNPLEGTIPSMDVNVGVHF